MRHRSLQQCSQSGQGLTEYAVILSLIAVAAIGTTAFFGSAVKSKIAALTSAISGDSSEQINKAEKQSQDAAKRAIENSAKVSGMKIDADAGNHTSEVFDEFNL
ncbi:MAG: hypothetical protein K2X39_08230 [Silvanigrellaceae bacterium]|nr:hypothetical protein [Silvanigrellaceae bacterium]